MDVEVDQEQERAFQLAQGKIDNAAVAEERTDLVMKAVDHWIHIKASGFPSKELRFDMDHDCGSNLCEMDRLCIQSFKANRIYDTNEHQHHQSAHWKEEPGTHTCYGLYYRDSIVKRICTAPHVHDQEKMRAESLCIQCIWEDNNIYVCQKTGKLHWCGTMCDQKNIFDPITNVATCRITGSTNINRSVMDNRLRDDDSSWKERQSLYRKTFCQAKSQANIEIENWCRELMHCSTVREIQEFIHVWTKSTRFIDMKKAYLMIALSRIWMLLCKESTRAFENARQNLEQFAKSFLEERFNSHRHRVLQSREKGVPFTIMVLSDLDCEYRHICQSQKFSKSERVDNVARFMLRFARMTMMVWQVIHMHTSGLKVQCNINGFKNFVIPCLYMLRDGLVVQGENTSVNQNVVYTSHPILKKILPTPEKLKMIRYSPAILAWHNRSNMESVIKHAINNLGKSPRCFDIQEMEYVSLQREYFPSNISFRRQSDSQELQLIRPSSSLPNPYT